jgi:hypothetical protein
MPSLFSARSFGWLITTKFAECCFRPVRDTCRNSGRFLRRADFGKVFLPFSDVLFS